MRTYLRRKFCDGEACFNAPDLPGPLGKYTVPECADIVAFWEKSDWKRQADEAEKRRDQEQLDHAKAFVGALSRQKMPEDKP